GRNCARPSWELIFGFKIFLGSCLVFKAELWGILDDLDILIDQGYDNVLVQTDSFEVANAVKKGLRGRSNSALIKKILQQFSRLQL
ncbi:hypothetical protein Goarm_004786, partial [Gossypium armourianum]|nr:hypothetical protein [Gossypium armourianum]